MNDSPSALFDASRRLHADRTALIFGDRRWSYHDLDELAGRLAGALDAAGIGAGDRVAFLLPNCPELVLLYLACFRLGAVAVPLNIRLTGAELAYVLNHSGARLVVSHAELYPALESAREELPQVERYYLVGEAVRGGTALFAELLSGPRGHWPEAAGDMPAAILYTSGTTARPKGVTHTHRGLAHTVRNFRQASGLAADDLVCGMLPMAHIFGFTLQMLAPLSVGATVAILPRFEPGPVLDLLRAHHVTHLYGLPVMFNALVHHPRSAGLDLSGLRYCLAGGDAVPRALHEGLRERFGTDIHEGCGMTEVIPYALNRPGMENRVGSIGRASVGMELRLVDIRGHDVDPGQPGEVLVRSEAVMAGYWRDPEATAAAIQAGWLHTGDMARADPDGYYWFVGRGKEIIVRGGSNISPLEVESALYSHPAVREAAVVGVPDAGLGEIVRAFVALKDGCAADEADLKAHVGRKIAAYKVPETIIFLNELPKGLTGKVQRRALRNWTPPADPTE
jgi:long-chain acyl-CoA synthetase